MNKLILKIIRLAFIGQEGHVPSALSILDLIDTVYKKYITKNKLNKFVLKARSWLLGSICSS